MKDAIQNSKTANIPKYLANYRENSQKEDVEIEEEVQGKENNILPEYLNWATSAAGITSARQNFETLESYGDIILKFSATLLAYEWKKGDRRAGEGDIENMKVAFITNSHLFRVAFNLRLHRYVKTLKDPDPREWIVPLSEESLKMEQTHKSDCIGKSMSDCIEALIGALYLTSSYPERELQTGVTGLYRAMTWLNDIKCVPLKTAGIMEKIRMIKQSSLDLKVPIKDFNFDQFDKIEDVFSKYFKVQG